MQDSKDQIHIKTDRDTITILHGAAYVHNPESFDYGLQSLQGVLDLIGRKGDSQKTVVFYNDANIQVILDDTITDRSKDTALYSFANSIAYTHWKNIFGKAFQQKELIDFLKNHPEDIVGGVDSLISAVSKLKITTEIVGDYWYDDNNNITFMFKSKDGEGAASIPAKITLCVPIFNESDFVPQMEVELQLNKPKAETEKPTIVLTCPRMEFYRKAAVDFTVNALKEALPGFLIMAGSPR